MGVRINKVLNDLNIGLQTAIDFLKQRRDLGEVRDDMTPNTKISDEQYEALVKKFGVDKIVKERAEALLKISKKNSNTTNKNENSHFQFFPKDSSSNNSKLTRNVKPLDDFNWDEFEEGVQATIPENVEVPKWVLEVIDYADIINTNIAGFTYESLGIMRMNRNSINYTNILKI